VTNTRRSPQTPVSALLALLLPLAACGGDGTSSAPPTPEDRGVTAETLSGFARLAESSSGKTVYLTFHDVDDGVQKLFLDLTELTDRSANYMFFLDTTDFAFSADFRHAAYETSEGEIRLAELDADSRSYHVTAVLAPDEAAPETEDVYGVGSEESEAEVSYQSPQFSPNGSELWFEERREGEEKYRVLAVPTDAPLDNPPEERGEVPHDSLPLEEYEGALLLKGPESSFIPKAAYTATTDNKLQILTSPRGAATQEFHFLTDGTRVASRNFLPGPSGNFVGLLPKDGQGGEVDHSTLRTFKLSPDGEVSDVEELVTLSGKKIERIWTDFDNNRYVLYADGTYYGFPFHARGGSPTELFSEFTFDDSVSHRTDSARILGIIPKQGT